MLKKLLSRSPKPRRWTASEAELPWLDRSDASKAIDARVSRGEIDPADAELLHKWDRDGYVVLDGAVPEETIDALNSEIDGLWTADSPKRGLAFRDLVLDVSGAPPTPETTHADLLKLPPEEREAVNKRGFWRIHGLHYHSQHAKALYDNAEARRMVDLILGRTSPPRYSITFMWGSTQHLHQDLMVFHIHPPNFLVGCWIALEDIHPDSGPLVYYPGSHREPTWSEFDNYPQTNVRTSTAEGKERYEAWLDTVAERHERKEFVARKGQLILWHAMLIHGGAGIRDRTRSRRSFVTHFIPDGVDKADEVVGPFMW